MSSGGVGGGASGGASSAVQPWLDASGNPGGATRPPRTMQVRGRAGGGAGGGAGGRGGGPATLKRGREESGLAGDLVRAKDAVERQEQRNGVALADMDRERADLVEQATRHDQFELEGAQAMVRDGRARTVNEGRDKMRRDALGWHQSYNARERTMHFAHKSRRDALRDALYRCTDEVTRIERAISRAEEEASLQAKQAIEDRERRHFGRIRAFDQNERDGTMKAMAVERRGADTRFRELVNGADQEEPGPDGLASAYWRQGAAACLQHVHAMKPWKDNFNEKLKNLYEEHPPERVGESSLYSKEELEGKPFMPAAVRAARVERGFFGEDEDPVLMRTWKPKEAS